MAFDPLRLVDPTVITTSATQLHTAVSRATLVREIICANLTAGAVTVRIALVPTGHTADGTNTILNDVTVAANDTLVFDCFIVLNIGDKLSGRAGANSSIMVTSSGVGL